MANADAPMGLRPIRHKNGAPYNGACSLYYVPSSDGTALYLGDAVIVNGTAHTDGTPIAVKASASTASTAAYITGVVVGFKPDPDNLTYTYRPASTARYMYVADDPDIVFECQEDSVSGALAITAVSTNIDLILGTGSTVTGLSGTEIDSSTTGSGATHQIKLLRPVYRPDNVAVSAYCNWEVMINLHTQRYTTGI